LRSRPPVGPGREQRLRRRHQVRSLQPHAIPAHSLSMLFPVRILQHAQLRLWQCPRSEASERSSGRVVIHRVKFVLVCARAEADGLRVAALAGSLREQVQQCARSALPAHIGWDSGGSVCSCLDILRHARAMTGRLRRAAPSRWRRAAGGLFPHCASPVLCWVTFVGCK